MEDIFQILFIVAIALFFSTSKKKKKKADEPFENVPDEVISTMEEYADREAERSEDVSMWKEPDADKARTLAEILQAREESEGRRQESKPAKAPKSRRKHPAPITAKPAEKADGVNLNDIDEIRRGIIWSEILRRKY